MKKFCLTGFKVNNADKKALENYLLDTPKEWAQKALLGMINKAVKTIIRDYLDVYKSKGFETVPATYSELITALISLDEFKPYKRQATEKRKPARKEAASEEIWSGGFNIEDWQEAALNAYYDNPEQVLIDYMENKISLRKAAFVKEWTTRLMNDAEVTEIPTHDDDLIETSIARPEYKNRATRYAEEEARMAMN